MCAIPEVTERLENQMFGAFMEFVRTGKPAQELLPEWTAVTEEQEPTMIFDKECEVRYNFDDALFERINSILPPCNLMETLNDQDVQH